MLAAVTSISKQYPATFVLAFLGLFIQIAYSVYFMTVISGCYEMYYDKVNQKTPGKLKALIVFCFFSFYWTSQVIKNIIHVTISGVFATYYFMAGSPQGMVKSPTLASFKRACTTSIGSICFGSLIIAVIQTLRAIVQMLRADSDNGVMAFLACLIDCFLSMYIFCLFFCVFLFLISMMLSVCLFIFIDQAASKELPSTSTSTPSHRWPSTERRSSLQQRTHGRF